MSRIVKESVNLHYQDGRSDKVYNIELVEVGPNQYEVIGYNGRRGSTLTEQRKTDAPVSYAQAKRIYDDLENSKVRHRSTPYSVVGRNGGVGTPSTSASPAPAAAARAFDATGYVAKHPKPIDREIGLKLLENDDWYAEQKADGVFMTALYKTGRVTASNKLGKGISAPPKVAAALRELVTIVGCEISLGVAGEYLGGDLHIFRLWEKNAVGLESLPWHLRVAMKERMEEAYQNHLLGTGKAASEQPIKFIRTAKTTAEKKALYERLIAEDAEGMVLTHRESGDSVKVKFWETCECIVTPNSQRSAECFVYHRGKLQSIGSVTCPNDAVHKSIKEANGRGEKVIASIRYLYLSGPLDSQGQLTQATWLRVRDDFPEASCTGDELKVTNKSIIDVSAPAAAAAVEPAPSQPEAPAAAESGTPAPKKARRRKPAAAAAAAEPAETEHPEALQASPAPDSSSPGEEYSAPPAARGETPTLFLM